MRYDDGSCDLCGFSFDSDGNCLCEEPERDEICEDCGCYIDINDCCMCCACLEVNGNGIEDDE